MLTYLNGFYQGPNHSWGGPREYATEAHPVEYRGALVVRRLPKCHDVVIDGVCAGQYVGAAGARELIDLIRDEPENFWTKRAMDTLNRVREVASC